MTAVSLNEAPLFIFPRKRLNKHYEDYKRVYIQVFYNRLKMFQYLGHFANGTNNIVCARVVVSVLM